MDASLPLITFTSDTHGEDYTDFQVSEDALRYLETIPAPISVVSVAGMYRTGKSYLLNRVILNQKTGFTVGPSVNPCTKGLWVWGRTLSAVTTDDEHCQVVVIDSEGIGALDEDADHDARIFSLAILLSSVFIYNSTVAIDETSLENLSLVVNLTKHIHVRSQQGEDVDEQDYAAYFPTFCWVVRDFSLQLIDDQGDKITSKEYLEKALSEQKGFAEATEERNRIRRLLRGFFPDRDCMTMVRPTNNEELLCRLEEVDLKDLRPEFQTQVFRLREKLLTKVKPKALNGKPLSGAMLANLLRAYVTAINAGAVPSIESAWTYICQNECSKAVAEAMKTYTVESDCNINPSVSLTAEELKQWHKDAKNKALTCFNELAVGTEKDAVQKELLSQIHKKFSILKEKNEETAREQTDQQLQSLYTKVEDRLHHGEFSTFRQYMQEMKAFETYFRENGPKGTQRTMQLVDFSYEKSMQTAEEFIEKLTNELEVSNQLANERIAAATKELNEVKEEYARYKNESQSKISALESEKAELTVSNTALRSQLELSKAERERLEKEHKDALTALRQELTGHSQEAETRIRQLEEERKQQELTFAQLDSDHQQETALLTQKIAFLERSLEETTAREQDYLAELTSQKKEHSVTVRDLLGKHEDTVSKIQQKIEAESDRVVELEEELKSWREKAENLQALKKESEIAAESKVAGLTSQIAALKALLESKETEHRQEKNDLIEEMESTEERLQTVIDEGKKRLKSQEDAYSSEKSKLLSANAILTQQMEFLQQQLEESKRQFAEAEQHHETMLATIRATSLTMSQGQVDQEILRVRSEMVEEMKRQQVKSDAERDKLLKENADLAETLEAINVKARSDCNEWKAKEQNYAAKIEQLASEKASLAGQISDLQISQSQDYEQKIDRLEAKVEELTVDLELAQSKSSQELAALNQRASESLKQLTATYEEEKVRLMQLVQKEKEKTEARLAAAMEEFEDKAREEAALSEDRIAELESQLEEVESLAEAQRSEFQRQSALDAQKISSLENSLKEVKETLSAFQSTHGVTMEQQLLSFQRERASLQVKIERLATELSGKDKDLMTALYANEQMTSQLALKERELEEVKTDFGSERALLQERLEDYKQKLRQLTDDSTKRKSEFAKDLALARQELEFQSKRLSELSKVKEDSERRLQDTLSLLKEERTREVTELSERCAAEREALEKKLAQKRKEVKEVEENYMKQVAVLEKERAVASEKITSLEAHIAEMEIRHSQESSQPRADRKETDSRYHSLQQEIDRLQSLLSTSGKEITEKSSAHDRDKVLWENKFNFLMAQRDAARTELANAQRKFEQSIEELRKINTIDKERAGKAGYAAELESRLHAEMREITEKAETRVGELGEKNKALERELRIVREELELERRDRSASSGSVNSRLQELIDSELRMKSQLQAQTAQWEKRINEEKQAFEQEKNALKGKTAALEQRAQVAEQQYAAFHLETEKERARAAMDRDHLLAQRSDFQEKAAQMQKRNEALLKENEKLRAERSTKNRSPIGGRKETTPKLVGAGATFQELMQSKGDSHSSSRSKKPGKSSAVAELLSRRKDDQSPRPDTVEQRYS